MERKSIWLTLFEQHVLRQSNSYFTSLRDTRAIELFKGVKAKSFAGDDCLFSHIEVDPYIEVPEHHHAYRQMGLMLCGEMEMIIGGERQILSEGDVYLIPSHVPHGANTSAEGSGVLEIYTPLDASLMNRLTQPSI